MRIVDRKKDMMLVSGFNVYPTKIEQVINLHPDVLECAAVGVPDGKSGEAVKLFVVKRDSALSEDDLAGATSARFYGANFGHPETAKNPENKKPDHFWPGFSK